MRCVYCGADEGRSICPSCQREMDWQLEQEYEREQISKAQDDWLNTLQNVCHYFWENDLSFDDACRYLEVSPDRFEELALEWAGSQS